MLPTTWYKRKKTQLQASIVIMISRLNLYLSLLQIQIKRRLHTVPTTDTGIRTALYMTGINIVLARPMSNPFFWIGPAVASLFSLRTFLGGKQTSVLNTAVDQSTDFVEQGFLPTDASILVPKSASLQSSSAVAAVLARSGRNVPLEIYFGLEVSTCKRTSP